MFWCIFNCFIIFKMKSYDICAKGYDFKFKEVDNESFRSVIANQFRHLIGHNTLKKYNGDLLLASKVLTQKLPLLL